ncbi:hypothetical protein AGLY_013392 [Aphis glycines]|uniref:Uncharacterized protein n=1 Tax=Aphis glycines TaxID=307491 RepID=A0A6G0T672_APHGL|nr:hypothetical protein AGLY_013392 [Aphis glycines]
MQEMEQFTEYYEYLYIQLINVLLPIDVNQQSIDQRFSNCGTRKGQMVVLDKLCSLQKVFTVTKMISVYDYENVEDIFFNKNMNKNLNVVRNAYARCCFVVLMALLVYAYITISVMWTVDTLFTAHWSPGTFLCKILKCLTIQYVRIFIQKLLDAIFIIFKMDNQQWCNENFSSGEAIKFFTAVVYLDSPIRVTCSHADAGAPNYPAPRNAGSAVSQYTTDVKVKLDLSIDSVKLILVVYIDIEHKKTTDSEKQYTSISVILT